MSKDAPDLGDNTYCRNYIVRIENHDAAAIRKVRQKAICRRKKRRAQQTYGTHNKKKVSFPKLRKHRVLNNANNIYCPPQPIKRSYIPGK